jgi:hypothetical protein
LVKNKDVSSNKLVLTLKIKDITVQEQQKVALFHLIVLENVVMLILNLIHAAISQPTIMSYVLLMTEKNKIKETLMEVIMEYHLDALEAMS